MAYRQPAEDEEAKRDAAEVEVLRRVLARGEKQARWRAVLIVVGLALVAAAIFGAALYMAGHPHPAHREECHYAYSMHVRDDGEVDRKPYLVCPDGGR
jgi:hypothetical protein